MLLLVVAVLGTACTAEQEQTGSEETPAPTPRATPATTPGVLYAFSRQPSAIIPAVAVDADDLAIVDQLFDGLTAVGADLEVVPAAAREWETNEDATVHTFHLREGATFHDGTPVTAASFVRAWERVADRGVDPPSAAHHLLDVVVGIEAARQGEALVGAEAVDDHTLRVTLSEPFSEFPARVSHPSLAPLPLAGRDGAAFERMPVGNGPFRMVEPWQPGQFVRLEPYADHPDANTEIDQLVFRIYAGAGAVQEAYEDFQRHTLHLAPVPDAVLAEAVATFGSAVGGEGPGVVRDVRFMTVYYAFNVEVPPFDVPEVRRAIALSIDRQAVLTATNPETRVAARSLVPPVLEGYEPGACAICDRDPVGARQLLADAEVELDRVELTVHDDDEHVAAADEVRRAVDEVLGEGTIEVRALPTDDWLEAVRGGEAGFFLSGWIAEYPSPGAFLDALFHPARDGAGNVTRFAEPDVRELLEEARATVDRDQRYALYAEVEELLLRDAPVIPLYHYRHARVLSTRAPGLVLGPMGLIDPTATSLVEED